MQCWEISALQTTLGRLANFLIGFVLCTVQGGPEFLTQKYLLPVQEPVAQI